MTSISSMTLVLFASTAATWLSTAVMALIPGLGSSPSCVGASSASRTSSSASVRAASLSALSPPSAEPAALLVAWTSLLLPFTGEVAFALTAFSSAICRSSLRASVVNLLAFRARSLALCNFASLVRLAASVACGAAIFLRRRSPALSTSSSPPLICRSASSNAETEPAWTRRAEWCVLISDRSWRFRSSTEKESLLSAAEISPEPEAERPMKLPREGLAAALPETRPLGAFELEGRADDLEVEARPSCCRASSVRGSMALSPLRTSSPTPAGAPRMLLLLLLVPLRSACAYSRLSKLGERKAR